MEKELSSNALKLNVSENTKKTLEQTLTKKEAELKKLGTQQVRMSYYITVSSKCMQCQRN